MIVSSPTEPICLPLNPVKYKYSTEAIKEICECGQYSCGAKCNCYLPGTQTIVSPCRPRFCKSCGCTATLRCFTVNECPANTFYQR